MMAFPSVLGKRGGAPGARGRVALNPPTSSAMRATAVDGYARRRLQIILLKLTI
jgi:hypothetical protein